MTEYATPGADGNAGAMGGNSGADRREDPEFLAIRFGPGEWRSAKKSGLPAIDHRNE